MKRPVQLRFCDRTFQGQHFHLVTVEWARNRFPSYHTHDYAEIFWLTQGECEHFLNGQSEQLKQGVVVLMRPSDAHELRASRGRGGFRFTNLSISPGCFARLQAQYPEEVARLYLEGSSPQELSLSATSLEVLNGEMRQLAAAPHDQFHLERAILNIWARFLEAPVQRLQECAVPDWLQRALIQVQEPEVFSKGVTGLVDVAARCHEHVTRECRRHLGKTATEVVNEARLRHAAHALRMTSRSVTEITMDCGFENPAQFFRIFRKAYGVSPGVYRTGL